MKILTLLLVLAFMSVGGCGGTSDNEEKPINNPVLKDPLPIPEPPENYEPEFSNKVFVDPNNPEDGMSFFVYDENTFEALGAFVEPSGIIGGFFIDTLGNTHVITFGSDGYPEEMIDEAGGYRVVFANVTSDSVDLAIFDTDGGEFLALYTVLIDTEKLRINPSSLSSDGTLIDQKANDTDALIEMGNMVDYIYSQEFRDKIAQVATAIGHGIGAAACYTGNVPVCASYTGGLILDMIIEYGPDGFIKRVAQSGKIVQTGVSCVRSITTKVDFYDCMTGIMEGINEFLRTTTKCADGQVCALGRTCGDTIGCPGACFDDVSECHNNQPHPEPEVSPCDDPNKCPAGTTCVNLVCGLSDYVCVSDGHSPVSCCNAESNQFGPTLCISNINGPHSCAPGLSGSGAEQCCPEGSKYCDCTLGGLFSPPTCVSDVSECDCLF